ncbi:MAG: hypothetical protein ACI8V5_001976, partial [Limisphaerales bacterium]
MRVVEFLGIGFEEDILQDRIAEIRMVRLTLNFAIFLPRTSSCQRR